MAVFALTSHKGGTGRSTATANVAYRLANDGLSVCCVDLDLDSPTLGSIFGFPEDVAVGADTGVHHFLVDPASPGNAGLEPVTPIPVTAVDEVLRDCWSALSDSADIIFKPGQHGQLRILPGSRPLQGYELIPPNQMEDVLAQLLDTLSRSFQIVLIDVRSGLSEIAGRLLMAGRASGLLDRWLLFLRWTPQHILAASELYGRLKGGGLPVDLIRTAVPSLNRLQDRNSVWFRDQDRKLTKMMNDHLPTKERPFTVPHEPMLQWQERVLTDSDVTEKLAGAETVTGYKDLATYLKDVN